MSERDFIHKAATDYCFVFGDGRVYTPTEAERAMLEDFGNSLISMMDDANARHTPGKENT